MDEKNKKVSTGIYNRFIKIKKLKLIFIWFNSIESINNYIKLYLFYIN